MIQTRIARMRSLAMPTAFRRRSILFAAEVANKAVARQVVWVYAVASGLDREHLAGLAGVGGEPVRTISEADIHAVVGSVDAAAFGESSIAGMLGDLADLEPIGRAHHEVVATIAAESPVVPLRLATIYPDDDTVSALLAEHHAELTELLESLRGTQEWGVQVYLRPAAGEAVPAGVTAGVPAGGDGGGSTGPQQPWLVAEASADQIDRVLSDIAVVSRRQPAPYLRPGSVCGWMVLNGIYLLDADRAAEFAAIARQFAAEHATLRVEITGPWPPYSFVDRDDV
jgi:hypothetical protein